MEPDAKPMRLPLFLGLLLMTSAGPPTNAADSGSGKDRLLTDFGPGSADFGWYVLNDNVMGGRSEGDFSIAQGDLCFSGRTNTRGGGFSSIRTQPLRLDLSNQTGIRVRVKGDGRRYTWRLTTGARWRGREISYRAEFETGDQWRTVDIPFSSFVPRFRGYQLDGPALDASDIRGMGLMIYDKLDGPFEIQVATVHAYTAEP